MLLYCSLVLVSIVFRSRPKNPASIAQVLQKTVQFGSIFNMWKVMTKTGFILVAPIFASCIFIFGVIITALNELLLANFPVSVINNSYIISNLYNIYICM